MGTHTRFSFHASIACTDTASVPSYDALGDVKETVRRVDVLAVTVYVHTSISNI